MGIFKCRKNQQGNIRLSVTLVSSDELLLVWLLRFVSPTVSQFTASGPSKSGCACVGVRIFGEDKTVIGEEIFTLSLLYICHETTDINPLRPNRPPVSVVKCDTARFSAVSEIGVNGSLKFLSCLISRGVCILELDCVFGGAGGSNGDLKIGSLVHSRMNKQKVVSPESIVKVPFVSKSRMFCVKSRGTLLCLDIILVSQLIPALSKAFGEGWADWIISRFSLSQTADRVFIFKFEHSRPLNHKKYQILVSFVSDNHCHRLPIHRHK